MTKSTIQLNSMELMMIILFTKIFKVGNKDQDQQTKTDLEEAFKQIKDWMDIMCLKLN